KEELKEEADQVIEHLASVRNKLKSVGKELVVMLCPSKAMFTHDQLDPIYQEKKEADAINGREYYLQALKEKGLPFVDSASYANEAKYPLFYPYGIHWSLTYGQLCTTKLIDRCEELTGNTYDNLVLDEVIESKSPFRNEEDLLWLMNVVSIGKTPTYHKYVEKREHNPNSKPLKIFLYGDSFGEMIQAFIQTTIEEDDVTLLNRNQFVCEGDGCNVSMDRPLQEINHDFNNVDLKRHLDESDVVVIEMVDPELAKFTYGFAEYLDGYLDSYIADRKAGK
ncbi:MAG: hypothetical protein IJ875_05575, partial [Solobacterium sp.]|nr:hypothetical protein [Solobacterium sp.]